MSYASTHDKYLTTEVVTATPQKLQLMLIDAAIRLIQRARGDWLADRNDAACEALIRAQEIMTHMLSSLNHEINPSLTKKVAAVYFYVYRTLVEASLQRDTKRLDDALRVLSIEQGTWSEVCRQLGSAANSGPAPAPLNLSDSAPPRSYGGRPLPVRSDIPTGGFSIEV